ncbi:MAG: GGDEF domain-containing protein, partial [Eubacteriales bacterium]|nr:GGDEF domain-containing protein [Eubacteriales bacterium]
DALTKVKNITAYTDKVAELAKTISENEFTEFGIILCDINDLKKENDTYGHDIGDIYIMNCCRVICAVFGHSPVFRIGGDEFAVVLQGEDYRERDNLMRQMDDMVNTLSKISSSELGKASFASGMAVYDPAVDESVSDVFRRADTKMYENKNRIKDGE